MIYFILLLIQILNVVFSFKPVCLDSKNFFIKARDGLEISAIYKNSSQIENKKNPLIFIHGSNAGGWIYDEYWLDYFSSYGYESYAINMRGSNVTGNLDYKKDINFIDHTNDLEDIIKYFNKNIGKPTIIAHSYGGLVLTKYYENIKNRNSTNASIWISSLPPSGEKYLLPRFFFRKNIIRVINSALSARLDTKIGLNKLLFYDDCTKDYDVEWYINNFQKDSNYLLDRLSISNNLPDISKFKNENIWSNESKKFVLGSYDDFILDRFSVYETKKIVNSNKPEFLRECGHNMMLGSNWRIAADKIINFLSNT